jgi:hypothetical protein
MFGLVVRKYYIRLLIGVCQDVGTGTSLRVGWIWVAGGEYLWLSYRA